VDHQRHHSGIEPVVFEGQRHGISLQKHRARCLWPSAREGELRLRNTAYLAELETARAIFKPAAGRSKRQTAPKSERAGSIPCASAGAQRWISCSVKAPLPQPTSIHRWPVAGDSQSRKTCPTSWLQAPIMRS
jgi:hypothetical protein